MPTMTTSHGSSAMTPRHRWLAALDMAPVDRLPFWPKLSQSYPRVQSDRFSGWSIRQFHRWIGSDPHEWVSPGLREVRNTTSTRVERSGDERKTWFVTARGALCRVDRFDSHSQSWHPVEFPVKDRRGIELMTEWAVDGQWEVDSNAMSAARARCAAIGESALTAVGIGKSPLMLWIEYLAGVENAHYLLFDEPTATERLFEVLHTSLLQQAELLGRHHPADVFYMVENTSTTLISVKQFQQYCMRHLNAYARIIQEHGGRLILHMCGHLKALLPDLSLLPVTGFEAFTAPPVGNTQLIDGRQICPDTCLIGGTSAVTWLKTTDAIVAEIDGVLRALPHRRGVVVTSAGVMPPLCPPETIREVCHWVQQYST